MDDNAAVPDPPPSTPGSSPEPAGARRSGPPRRRLVCAVVAGAIAMAAGGYLVSNAVGDSGGAGQQAGLATAAHAGRPQIAATSVGVAAMCASPLHGGGGTLQATRTSMGTLDDS
ncbi:MAG TPA: hypothetical protein VKQ71_10380 [Acidimicrobiales bacterium]|nr:hypothetical protein [Acidimicrobiales bacterium]